MEWVELLRDELDSDSIDFSTPATILQGLFQHALLPNISVDANGKLRFSDAVTVKVWYYLFCALCWFDRMR